MHAQQLIARSDDDGLSDCIANSNLPVRDNGSDVNPDYTGFWNELKMNIFHSSAVRTGQKCIARGILRWIRSVSFCSPGGSFLALFDCTAQKVYPLVHFCNWFMYIPHCSKRHLWIPSWKAVAWVQQDFIHTWGAGMIWIHSRCVLAACSMLIDLDPCLQ